MKEKIYTFYIVHCTDNDKKYIGCTSQDLSVRWSSHKSGIRKGGPAPFYKEAYELGVEKFYCEELEKGFHTRQSAVEREEELINEYDSRYNGYNDSWSRPLEQNGWYKKGASNDNFTNPQKNPSKGKIQKTSIPVTIEGIEYPSMSHASRSLDIDRMLVKYRVNSISDRFSEWKYTRATE